MLANRLKKRQRHLQRWARRAGVSCYRLYDRDIPEVPLIVDWYEGRLHVSERAHPEEADHVGTWVDAAAAALGVPAERVFVKRRERQRGTQQYVRVAQAGAVFEVGEGGLRFRVNLSDYVDTGLFLDHRITRALVRDESRGRRVLNLYAYTGAFSVYAAAGGARSVTSVDLSNTYLDWARENMALNGLSGTYERADVLAYLEAPGERFDLIVLDPPTFSNSKRTEGVLDIQRDHPALLRAAIARLRPGGVLYFSCNRKRFSLELDAPGLVEITDRTVPEDFARSRPHRCWRLSV